MNFVFLLREITTGGRRTKWRERERGRETDRQRNFENIKIQKNTAVLLVDSYEKRDQNKRMVNVYNNKLRDNTRQETNQILVSRD